MSRAEALFDWVKEAALARFGYLYRGQCSCGKERISLRGGSRTCECGQVIEMHRVEQQRLVA